jgi:hypothetical protein
MAAAPVMKPAVIFLSAVKFHPQRCIAGYIYTTH